MPRTEVGTGTINDQDYAVEEKIRRNASGHCKRARRVIEQFYTFIDENKEGLGSEMEIGRAKIRFLSHISARGLAPSTVASIGHILRSFGVGLENRTEVRQRLEETEFYGGLERLSTDGTFTRTKARVDLKELLRPIANPGLGDEHRAFWAMCVITGNRPANILKIAGMRVEEDGLAVRWGNRKGGRYGGRGHLKYLYEWTFTPSSAILETLKTKKEGGWLFDSSSNIASAVNSWLNKTKVEYTSTAGRDFLSRRLLPLVDQGKMPGSLYEDLLDHQLGTARRHYAD